MAGVTPTLIVALDFPTSEEAMEMVDRLGEGCRFYKVGSELFTAEGPAIVGRLRERGCAVFLDVKLHDIPTTVRGGARAAARMGVSLITVHASGGQSMITAAVEGAGTTCGVLAVTVLTSLDGPSLAASWGRAAVDIREEVLRLSATASAAGAFGIVCGGHEVSAVRAAHGAGLRIVVPGVRAGDSGENDQARVVTPLAAAAAGASHLVVGRTVTQAVDPAAAMRAIVDSLASTSGAHYR
ncbi:MAG: orotidine-5'-phosphate decarboxylase [Gemmatimonadaceae bacterium]